MRKPFPKTGRTLRTLSNLWTLAFAAFLIANFALKNRYEYLVGPLSVVYTGVLSLYAGTKEFNRWTKRHVGRHPGELFVAGWTLMIAVFFAVALASGNGYRVSPEVVADYILVLSIFVVTRRSKQLYGEKARGGSRTEPQ